MVERTSKVIIVDIIDTSNCCVCHNPLTKEDIQKEYFVCGQCRQRKKHYKVVKQR